MQSVDVIAYRMGHWTLELCPIQSSMDIIVTQITTVVFGNIATVVALCKTLHWMQMANGSNVF